MGLIYFSWPDYLLVAIVLAVSAGIGFYYAFTGGKQKTTKEYLLADKGMHWFPVTCSLIATFESSLSLLGLPGEIYTFGTVIIYSFIFKPIGVIIAAKFYLPVFRKMGGISLYKYVRERYGRVIQMFMLVAGTFQMLMFCSLIMFGPALSISAVTGVNIWLAVISVAGVAIIYTVLGGLKAVLWTDTLQLVIMMGGTFVVLIYGIVDGGGMAEIWEANKLSGRLDFLEPAKFISIDPRVRHSIWGLAIHGIMAFAGFYGTNQMSFQRLMALRKKKSIYIVYGLTAFATCTFGILSATIGLIIFARNKHCDPLDNEEIFSKDQLYPHYVMRLMGHLPGLPGLILSAIFSASLSSLSSGMSAIAAIILQEFVKPCRPNMTDRTATIVSKLIALSMGGLLILLTFFAKNVGVGLFTTSLAIGGAFGSASFAVFTSGIFLPIVNQKGAIMGFLCGAAYSVFLGFGGLINRPYVYRYPVSTAGCNVTDVNLLTNLTSPVYDPSTWDPQSHYRTGIKTMFDFSYTWVGPSGLLVNIITSVIFGYIFTKKDDPRIPKRLLSPFLLNRCCLLPKSWRDRIDFEDSDIQLEDEKDENSSQDNNGFSIDDPIDLKTDTKF